MSVILSYNMDTTKFFETIFPDLQRNNSILVSVEKADYNYGMDNPQKFTVLAHRGNVLHHNNRWDSMTEREWQTATVRFIDENGEVGYKEVGGDQIVVDASPEKKKEYEDYLAYQKRRKFVLEKLRERNGYIRDAKTCGAKNYHQMKNLYRRCSSETYYEIVKLMESHKNNRLRSDFRKSLANQIEKWFNGENEYKLPLSPKQMNYLVPYRKW